MKNVHYPTFRRLHIFLASTAQQLKFQFYVMKFIITSNEITWSSMGPVEASSRVRISTTEDLIAFNA